LYSPVNSISPLTFTSCTIVLSINPRLKINFKADIQSTLKRTKILPSPIYRTFAISWGFATSSDGEKDAKCELNRLLKNILAIYSKIQTRY